MCIRDRLFVDLYRGIIKQIRNIKYKRKGAHEMRKVIAVFTAMILALSVWSVPTLSFAEENMIQNVGISSQQGRVKLIKADGAGDVTFTEEEWQNGSIMLEFDGSK